MNKTMKLAIPVVAVVVAAATGIGIAAARSGNQNTTYTPTSYDTLGTTPIWDDDAQSQYCGGAGMMESGMGLQITTERVATLLGATTADLKAQLETGKTLADIAKARGVSNDTLVQTILVPFQEHLDIMVKYGYLTQDQATAMANQAKNWASTIITSSLKDLTGGSLGYGGMMGGSSGMMGGWGDPLQRQGTATPRTGFGGMMGGSGGMMGGSGGMMSGW